MTRLAAIAGLALAGALPAQAQNVGKAEFVMSSDLSDRGFKPFETGDVGQVVYGMRKERTIYLCFIVDTPQLQKRREQVLLSFVHGKSKDRTVPNIPVACIPTE